MLAWTLIRTTSRMPDLAGVTVVVTRPAHQADELCHAIEQLNGVAVRFPVIEIFPPTDIAALKTQLQNLEQFQLAIFISANAVSMTVDLLNSHQPWPSNVDIAAVGLATQKALIADGLHVTHRAPKPFNSEALLSLARLQTLSGQRVMIFRGKGGRELLADTLRDRGANVEYAECYQRKIATTDVSHLYQLWDEGGSMPIVVTSNEGIKNLQAMVDDEHQAALLSSPLIVVSRRVGAMAKTLGFRQKPWVAEAASHDAILDAIKKWAHA